MASSIQLDGAIASPRTWRAHVQIARIDHWIKNVFVLPGIVVALALYQVPLSWNLIGKAAIGLLAASLVASSNYVINEICDAPFDRFHPLKRNRPVPAGAVIIPLAYAQWIFLGITGLALSWTVSPWFGWDMFALLVMGCVYNLPPVRTKDISYLDVLSEAINNPIRLLAGWFIVSATIPPISLLLSYWFLGCYFMALKRYVECQWLKDDGNLRKYRPALVSVTPQTLLNCAIFYVASATLFFGAFVGRHLDELTLSFPLIALTAAQYFSLAFEPDSPAEHPEKLYRERNLMLAVAGCVAVAVLCILPRARARKDAQPSLRSPATHVQKTPSRASGQSLDFRRGVIG